MSEKQKLTLSVNKEVVEKAKAMGINISEITENVLKGFAFTPTGLDNDEFYRHYNELFQSMLPLMKNYNFPVTVASYPEFDDLGNHMWTVKTTLLPTSIYYVDPYEREFSDIKNIEIHEFHSPMKILETFLTKLTSGVEQRREQIKELEMAKRILQAITGTIENREKTSMK